jgi:nucleoside-diphosphate-sugar epimerase
LFKRTGQKTKDMAAAMHYILSTAGKTIGKHLSTKYDSATAKVQAVQKDLTTFSTAELAALFSGCEAVCHLAFVLDSAVGKKRARAVDIEGTQKVFWGAKKAGVKKLVVSSSVSAYGARADNPARLTEDHLLRAGPGYRSGFHKAEVERLLALLAGAQQGKGDAGREGGSETQGAEMEGGKCR